MSEQKIRRTATEILILSKHQQNIIANYQAQIDKTFCEYLRNIVEVGIQPDLKLGRFGIYKRKPNCILAHNCSPGLCDKNGSLVYYMCQKFNNDWICWKCRTIAPEEVAQIANLCFCRES